MIGSIFPTESTRMRPIRDSGGATLSMNPPSVALNCGSVFVSPSASGENASAS
jgi:hypothetical protein